MVWFIDLVIIHTITKAVFPLPVFFACCPPSLWAGDALASEYMIYHWNRSNKQFGKCSFGPKAGQLQGLYFPAFLASAKHISQPVVKLNRNNKTSYKVFINLTFCVPTCVYEKQNICRIASLKRVHAISFPCIINV